MTLAFAMISVISFLRQSRFGISRVGLIVLFAWFAAPEAKSFSPTVNPQLHSQIVQDIFIHLELAKHDPGNSTAKQLLIIPYWNEIQAEKLEVSKLPKVISGLNSFSCNSFYVYTTINAP